VDLDLPHGQKSNKDPMGLSIRVRRRYGFAPSAHFGSTRSRMLGSGRAAAAAAVDDVGEVSSAETWFNGVVAAVWPVWGPDEVWRAGDVRRYFL
jgi:hypothetical protein